MASNPVYDRIEKDLEKGQFAGFEQPRNAAGSAAAGQGVQDAAVTAQLEDLYQQPAASAVQSGRVTYDDVIMKTLGLFAILLPLAAVSWWYTAINPAVMMPIFWVGMLGSLVIGLMIAFRKTVSVPLILGYAAVEGVFVGAISQVFEAQYPGIVSTAVISTLAVFAGMLAGYKFGIIKVTSRSRRIFGLALMGYLLFALANVVASLFGLNNGWGFGAQGSAFAIGISLLATALASYSLAVNFDTIDKAVAMRVPQEYSWLLAHGMIVTLVWLYLELLRLFANFRGQ